jgi:SPP1 gp7 family putative phage head morphogenesis protein
MTGPMPFAEAVDFFRAKVNLPSAAWTDLQEGAHARAFTVAGATTAALVEDFRRAVDTAIAEGRTKEDFLKDFDRIVEKHGWSYKGGRGWRAAVIYNTNLRTARAAGRWTQIERHRGTRPYIRYSAIMDGRTRPEHKQWHGLVLPVDDPFWDTHFPPNGWNCRCSALSVSDADLAREGWTVSPSPAPAEMEARTVTLADGTTETWETPAGVDTGFGYNVGRAGWLAGGVPPALQRPLPAYGAAPSPPVDLPPPHPPRPVDAGLILPAGLSDEDYARAFLAEFGGDVGRTVSFRDAAGHVIGLSDELFKRRDGSWKVKHQGRERFLMILAAALKNPDEIWLDWVADHQGRPRLRRRYLTALALPNLGGDARGAGLFAALEWTGGGWSGVTLFQPKPAEYLGGQRKGVLLYRRSAD